MPDLTLAEGKLSHIESAAGYAAVGLAVTMPVMFQDIFPTTSTAFDILRPGWAALPGECLGVRLWN